MNATQKADTKNRVIMFLFPFLAWFPMLNSNVLRIDIMAGITAGVLILPQAIALATVAGLPPEYGLYTSIFPVIIASLYGSSWHALSGPNTALAVLMAMTIAPFANIGTDEYVQYAITLAFMVGVVQLVIALLRLGAVFNYFSQTVMTALVTGVGIIIIIQQLGNFIGVVMNPNEDLDEIFIQIFTMLPHSNIFAIITGLSTVIAGVVVKKINRKLPHYIIAVGVGMFVAWVLNMIFGAGVTKIDMLGYMDINLLPFSTPDFSPQGFAEFSTFAYPAAMSMAFLGLMQSSIIARNMSATSGQVVNLNQEVTGQGLSNVTGSFFSCFTSCGSFNRSAANIQSGAITPLAGIISAVALFFLIKVAAPVIAFMPIAVMAGVLFLVGWALVDLRAIRNILRFKGMNRWIFIAVLALTLFSGLDDGVFLGVFLSIALYLGSVSKLDIQPIYHRLKQGMLVDDMTNENTRTLKVQGSLFFGSTFEMEKKLSELKSQDNRESNLIIDGEYIQNIDESGVKILVDESKKRQANGYRFLLRIRSELINLENGDIHNLINGIGENNLYVDGVPWSEKKTEYS